MHSYLSHGNSVILRVFPANSSNFCIVQRMNSDFYLYLPTFSNTISNKFSISFNYYFFIHCLFFFKQLYIFQHFFIQHLIIIIGKSHLKNEQQPIRLDELLFMSQKKFQLQRIHQRLFLWCHFLLQRIFCLCIYHWRCSYELYLIFPFVIMKTAHAP